MAYWKNGAFADDPFATTPSVTIGDWLDGVHPATDSPLALRLEPGLPLDPIAADLGRFALVKIAFPKFTDGRGYSQGWLLRTRYGFAGEMRAVGEVLFDEMQLMVRCGFDAFEITDPATIRLLREGRPVATVDRFYQPGLEPEMPEGTRPWARRAP